MLAFAINRDARWRCNLSANGMDAWVHGLEMEMGRKGKDGTDGANKNPVIAPSLQEPRHRVLPCRVQRLQVVHAVGR